MYRNLFSLNLTSEKSPKAWAYRLLQGPAMLIDGVVATLTGGTANTGLSLAVALTLSQARYEAHQKTVKNGKAE